MKRVVVIVEILGLIVMVLGAAVEFSSWLEGRQNYWPPFFIKALGVMVVALTLALMGRAVDWIKRTSVVVVPAVGICAVIFFAFWSIGSDRPEPTVTAPTQPLTECDQVAVRLGFPVGTLDCNNPEVVRVALGQKTVEMDAGYSWVEYQLVSLYNGNAGTWCYTCFVTARTQYEARFGEHQQQRFTTDKSSIIALVVAALFIPVISVVVTSLPIPYIGLVAVGVDAVVALAAFYFGTRGGNIPFLGVVSSPEGARGNMSMIFLLPLATELITTVLGFVVPHFYWSPSAPEGDEAAGVGYAAASYVSMLWGTLIGGVFSIPAQLVMGIIAVNIVARAPNMTTTMAFNALVVGIIFSKSVVGAALGAWNALAEQM